MDTKPKPYKPLLRLWPFFVVVAAIWLWFFWAVPNTVHSGPGKISGIINRLRQIEAAKAEWAIEHNVTNAIQLNRELTPNDLIPYMLPEFTNSLYGEVYSFGRLNESAQAQLTRDLAERGWPKSWTLPKGTIIKLGTNDIEEYIVPYPGSEFPKVLNEARSKK